MLLAGTTVSQDGHLYGSKVSLALLEIQTHATAHYSKGAHLTSSATPPCTSSEPFSFCSSCLFETSPQTKNIVIYACVPSPTTDGTVRVPSAVFKEKAVPILTNAHFIVLGVSVP